MKKIIVTGASRGIGFEMVKLFAEEGHQVLALSRNYEPISSLKLNNVFGFSFDLRKEEAIQKLTGFIKSEWGQVDVLINNAGTLIHKPFVEISSEEFENAYRVNVFGVAETIKAALPFMPKDGHVVNISSMGGVQGSVKFAGLSAYSSSKRSINYVNRSTCRRI